MLNANLQVQALQQVLVDDAEYKMRSHQAHKVSQSVLAINKCLQLNAPFKDELAALAQVGEVEPLIAVVAADCLYSRADQCHRLLRQCLLPLLPRELAPEVSCKNHSKR